jgi:hypothetical protein
MENRRFAALESHCISRLNRLRELKLSVHLLGERDSDLVMQITNALHDR